MRSLFHRSGPVLTPFASSVLAIVLIILAGLAGTAWALLELALA
tara:strand:+ start:15580 stop:15711 length:132 start_codon:yes stop_codon:yes gene_type:complete